MKKVLIVNEPLDMGGMDIAAIRFQQNLDNNKFESDYLVRRDTVGPLEPMVKENGSKVYHVPNSELNYLKSYRFYKRFFKEHHYDIIHCHLPFFSAIVFFAAKRYGNPVCVSHGHFTNPYNDAAEISRKERFIGNIYRSVMRVALRKLSDIKIACSKAAGYYLFGKRTFDKYGIVLNNGIDYSRFEYDKVIRKEVRDKFCVDDNTVILGHVGMMNSVKNQKFIIDIFDAYHKDNVASKLWLIGIGPDLEEIKNYANEKESKDDILFLEERNDVNELYQAMDCFVFPSIHEGFPLTLIEAQASKLPCLISDTVTTDTKINENVDFASIKENVSVWCNKINSLLEYDREIIDNSELIENFDIKKITKRLEKLYLGN